MTGSTYKRCTCRDTTGKILDRRCPELRKSDHGAWFYDLRADGRRYRKGGFDTKRDAQTALDDLRRRIDHGDDVTTKMTTGAWLEQWLAGKRSLRPSTAKSYREHIDLYLKPQLGDVPLDRLRTSHVSAMYDAIESANVDRERKVGPATVRRIHATLRSALNAAVKQRRLAWNPALHVELPAVPRKRVEPWQPDELGAFLDAAAADRLGPMYELMAMTGLRRGEAIGLRWCDLDLAGAVITVVQQVVDVGGKPTIGAPKTASGEYRKVDLDQATTGTLLAHRLQQDSDRAAWGSAWVDTGLVFTREDGSMLRPEYVTRRMQAIAAKAGLPRKRLHDLRHGSASLQLAAGVPIQIVSKRLGHSSITITADTYSHLLDGVGRQAAEAAAALVPRSQRGPILDPSAKPNATHADTVEASSQVESGGPPGDRTQNPRIKSAGGRLTDGAG